MMEARDGLPKAILFNGRRIEHGIAFCFLVGLHCRVEFSAFRIATWIETAIAV